MEVNVARPSTKLTGIGRTFVVLAGLLAGIAIVSLTFSVSNEIRKQSSAQSDNIQWSLSQTEVEFQEFYTRLRVGSDLTGIRRRFDVFYSRMKTLREAQVFEALRLEPSVAANLADISVFLEEAVVIIDGSDASLTANMQELAAMSEGVRPKVRGLATAGLTFFATNADEQREKIARILTQLAAILALLITALGIGVVYLVRLNQAIVFREYQQIRDSKRIKTIMNTSIDAVIVSDSNGHVIEFNQAAERIFGHKMSDVIGQNLGEIIVPDHMRHAHEAGMERMRKNGTKRVVGKGRVRLEAKHSSGSLFPVELAIQTAMTEEGEIFVAFLRDVTQQVADEAELIDARDKAIAGEKLRSDFLATMTHEIRTPLNGLIGNMSLLRGTDLTTEQDSFLGNMETSGRLLLNHVSDVLDIARYDSGKINTVLKPLSIPSLLQDIIDSQRSMAAAQGTTLEWKWSGPEQEWVNSNPDRLQHILMNLIGNAVKFTLNGSVMIHVGWSNNDATFTISDTGTGIDAELQTRMFDDFVTGNAGYDRVFDGTGLGLSIVKRSISALNGSISVESKEGMGSTFTVRVPAIAVSPPSHIAKSIEIETSSVPLHVLVVEDNEINRFVVRNMLLSDGHKVVEAHDGQQGVQIAQETVFDLILMDISMPVLDGRAAARRIRNGGGLSANTHIIALTANALPEERSDFLAHGMNGVLTKPLTTEALQSLVAGLPLQQRAERGNLIDHDHAIEMREILGPLSYNELSNRFCIELDEFYDWIVKSNNFAGFAARAHKIAGSSATFGATALQEDLKRLQRAATDKNTTEIDAIVKSLSQLIRETKQALGKVSRQD
ncbi:MAG: ATP-binding protein [Sphingorhabdus sp.]